MTSETGFQMDLEKRGGGGQDVTPSITHCRLEIDRCSLFRSFNFLYVWVFKIKSHEHSWDVWGEKLDRIQMSNIQIQECRPRVPSLCETFGGYALFMGKLIEVGLDSSQQSQGCHQTILEINNFPLFDWLNGSNQVKCSVKQKNSHCDQHKWLFGRERTRASWKAAAGTSAQGRSWPRGLGQLVFKKFIFFSIHYTRDAPFPPQNAGHISYQSSKAADTSLFLRSSRKG